MEPKGGYFVVADVSKTVLRRLAPTTDWFTRFASLAYLTAVMLSPLLSSCAGALRHGICQGAD
jgi:hypothetical protein